MLKKNTKSFIAPDFIVLLSIFSLFNSRYFLGFFNFNPIHDTVQSIYHFYFLYNEFYLNNIVPLWSPYILYGTTIDLFYMSISGAQFFIALIGKLLHVENTLILFKLSMVIEELALFIGVYLLAKRLFQHRATIIFICIGAMATTSWGIQIHWNFRVYYLIPLWLYFLIKFFDSYDFKHLWITGIIVIISLIGNVIYFLPLFHFITVIFMFALFITKDDHRAFRIKNISILSSLSWLILFLLLFFVYIDYVGHIFDHIQPIVKGRDFDNKVTLKTFLTYSSINHERAILEFIYSIPFTTDYFLYIGLIPLVFFIYALIYKRDDPFFITLTTTSIILIIFSLGSIGGIAYIVYYTFPGMNYFRHIGYVKVVSKILILIASGFGIDHYLSCQHNIVNNKNSKSKKLSLANIGIALFGIIVGINLLVFVLRFISKKTVYPINNYLPYQFHLFAILILIFFIYCVIKLRYNEKLSRIIVSLYFIEIASYCFISFYYLPTNISKFQAVYSVKMVNKYSENINFLKTAFDVRKYPFEAKRVNMDEMYAMRHEMPIMQSFLPPYFDSYSAFYVDLCLQEYQKSNIIYMSSSLICLIYARLDNTVTNKTMSNMHSRGNDLLRDVEGDEDFMKAIGCNTSKIRFVSNPVVVQSLDVAARMVKELPNLNEKPILLESSEAGHNKLLNEDREEGIKDLFKSNEVTKSLDIKFDVTKFTADTIEIAADTGSFDDVWLIYLDNYHPNWKATVNNKPASIARANIAFKAVKLDKGYNVVRFVFENFRNKIYIVIFFVVGIISSLTLIVSIIFLSVPDSYDYIKKRCADYLPG